jgi:hypothetical protein
VTAASAWTGLAPQRSIPPWPRDIHSRRCQGRRHHAQSIPCATKSFIAPALGRFLVSLTDIEEQSRRSRGIRSFFPQILPIPDAACSSIRYCGMCRSCGGCLRDALSSSRLSGELRVWAAIKVLERADRSHHTQLGKPFTAHRRVTVQLCWTSFSCSSDRRTLHIGCIGVLERVCRTPNPVLYDSISLSPTISVKFQSSDVINPFHHSSNSPFSEMPPTQLFEMKILPTLQLQFLLRCTGTEHLQVVSRLK